MRSTFTLLLAAVATAALAAAPVHAKDKGSSSGSPGNSGAGNGNSGNGNNGNGNGNGSGSTPTPTPTPTTAADGGGKIVLLTADCTLSTGCLFSGNDTKPDDIVSAYESVFSLNDLSLAFSQKVEFAGQVYGGAWSSPIPVSFLSVKAGNEFILYRFSDPATSGTWSTAGLVNNQGIAHAVSHLSFFTGSFQEPQAPTPPVVDPLPEDPGGPLGLPETQVAAVPEPATWISMILGFGVLGAELRRRRRLALAGG